MSGDNQPIDVERTRMRVNLSTAVLLSVLGTLVAIAVSAGVYQNRISNIDERGRSNTAEISAHANQLSELRTQLAVFNAKADEMLRRQERLENKLDAR